MPIQADEDEDVFAVPSQSKPATQPAALPVVDDADEDEDVLAVSPLASAGEPEDPTKGWGFWKKLDAAGAAKVHAVGSLADLVFKRLGVEQPKPQPPPDAEERKSKWDAFLKTLGREPTTLDVLRFDLGREPTDQEKRAASGYDVHGRVIAAPNKGVVNRLANLGGSLVVDAPAFLASGGSSAFGGVIGKVAPTMSRLLAASALPAISSTAGAAGAEVEASQQMGESPETQWERAKLSAAVNAPAALATGGTLGLTKLPARMAAQALTGAALGGTTSAVNDLAQQREIDWDAVLSNAALMGGMGLAHQALQWEKTSGKKFNTPEEAVADLKSEYTRWWESKLAEEDALRQSQAGAQALKADLAEQQRSTNPAAADPTLQRNKQFQAAYELFKQDLADKEVVSQRTDQKPTGVPEPASLPTSDARHTELFKQSEPTAGTGLSLSELSALTPDQFAARYGDVTRPDFTSPQAESIRLGNEAETSGQIAELKRLADQHSAAVEADRARALASGDSDVIQQHLFRDIHADLFRKAYEHALGSERGASPEQIAALTGKEPNAIPERSTTSTDVGQAPADRQTVGAREPGTGTKEPPGAQERTVPAQALRAAGPAEVSAPAEAEVPLTPAAPPPKGPPPPNPQITPTPPPPPNPPTAKNPGPWRNAYLRIRRNITEDVPEAAKKVVANFSRVHRVDGVYNTPGGQEFLRRTYGALDQFGQQSGRWGNQFNKAVAALGREKVKAANGEYADLYESGAPAPTPAAKPLWEAMETASREEAADMVRNKVEISDPKVEGGKRLFVPMLERHVPRVTSKQVVRALARKKGALYEALVPFQKVEETGAHTALKRELNTDNARSRRVAAIENARGEAFPDTVTLPSGEVVQVYNRNLLEIFPQYIENAARRTAIIEHFGDLREDGTWVNGQGGRAENVVNGLVAQVKETHPIAAKRMADTWADLNGNFSAEREAAMAESGLRTAVAVPDILARSSMLSGSVLSQPFAAVQVSTREGARNFLRNAVGATTAKTLERAGKRVGLSKLMPETLAKIEEVRDLGGSSTDSLGHTFNTEDLVGAVGSAAKHTLAKTGLNAANVHINDIAGMAALDNLSQSIAALKTPKAAGVYNNLTGKSPAAVRLRLKQNYGFTDADIARMVDSGVARADKARAVQQASKVNLYRESALERAPWMSSQMARTFLPFTSILRQTGYVAKDAAAAAVKTGNLRPLVTLVVGGHIAGAAVGALKDFARGKPDEPPSDEVVDSLRKMAEYQLKAGAFGYGGVPVESLLYAIDSGQIPELEPTVVGWYRTIAEGAVDSWQAGSPKPMAKAIVKATPALTILDRAVKGPVWQERQEKALRRTAKEFKSEQPGNRPEDPTVDKFLKALQSGDTKAARALLPGLRRAKGGSQAIREALDRHENYYLQGTKEAEEKWLKTLSPGQRQAYDAMQQARKETARLGRTLVR